MDYANIILEMLDRIKKLENEVKELKKQNEEKNLPNMSLQSSTPPSPVAKRDTTRYLYNGKIYLKNRLVLAIIKDYVYKNEDISRLELKNTFSKSLQGSIGTVEFAEIARERKDCDVRFFTKENEIIHFKDGDIYVCSQWGILNIPNFLRFAEQLGYKIESI